MTATQTRPEAAPMTTGRTINLIQAVTEAIAEEMERDSRVVLFGEDVGARGGVFMATAGLQERFGKNRVFDTPLSEASIVGAAVGMAVRGLRPIAEIQFADYMGPGFDQIISQAAKIRYRSGGQFTAPMVIRTPSGGGVKGGHHHSQSPESYYTHTPGLKVVMPSTPYDAKGLLKAALRGEDPVIYFEPKRLYRAAKGEVPDHDYIVKLGEAAVRREGSDLSLIGYGGVMPDLEKAADALAAEGVSVEVIDLRSLVPWDRDRVLTSVQKTGRAVLVSEAPRISNFMGEVAYVIQEQAFDYLTAPVGQVAGFDTPYPYVQDKVYLPGANRIVAACVQALNY
ncbi:alpha-ketoacid dehydrogenase subunit beta [Deinococcus soli (ex Cha et al. 2016)]|uniref:2-oxoisovalerate dehydrogenase E1 component beta subunit n=2 Tax=Deinococcus soli (ex Cha et al. 2016) TaxID=1309411 RepID=A0ACC6KMY6_9DEIO|nr:2-oxoisovalerate dehydrogenase E1 component beta subunit [Deinococcus soli (ex Cha et al. 2016)]MDR6330809.1 2-oxoisovalerate dehydrogenase E1 component beta subunit [Deinococcus soli (ex Cha et al. 2016)]MDR6753890.1 2-oxoisovalerate dehydrogenase E1 component beta subunit [Deinococcus soli (ex Cha et al. 2016)]